MVINEKSDILGAYGVPGRKWNTLQILSHVNFISWETWLSSALYKWQN